MYKLLIVDDEAMIREAIAEYAAEIENFEVKQAANGLEAVEAVKNEDFDVIIMDIMMPKMDGYAAVKEIRKTKNVPIIMLSARGEEYDKLFGFELGIDDYLVKPFSLRELMARLQSLVKRYRTKDSENSFRYKGFEVDFAGRNVFVDGEKVRLTPKEFELLKYLIDNKGIAVSRETLLSKVWGYDYFGEDRTVDTHVKMLRANMRDYRDLIVTIRGMGYKFEIAE